MQAMERRLGGAIGSGLMQLKGEVQTGFAAVHSSIDRLQSNLTMQIDAIDNRLDAIEIESLPTRVQALEKAAVR